MSQYPEANPGGSPSTEPVDSNPSTGSEIPAAAPAVGAASHPDQPRNPAPDPAGNSETESQSVILSDKQSELQTVQAAQLEHKPDYIPVSDSNLALAGGEKSPQTPLQNPQKNCDILIDKNAPQPAAKSRRKKRRDNHLSFRASADEYDIVAERMERTGESQSDAVRGIIRESRDKAGNIYLAPKTPPEQLETLLGELQKWRKAFATAKSRLNVPTPPTDDGRYAEVIAWRIESDRLLLEIPKLETVVKVALAALTNLTPERVARLSKGWVSLTIWKKQFSDKKQEHLVDFVQDLIDMLADAGIKPKEK